MLNKIPLIILFFISFISFAQPSIAWQVCYGSFDSDSFQDAILTSDGGIATAMHYGGTDGDAIGLYDLSYPAILTKYDSDFNIEWQKYFGGTTNASGFYKIAELPNLDFICGGATYAIDSDFADNHGSYDMILVRTNASGNKLWSKCYGSFGFEEFETVLATQDNGFILTGRSTNSGGDIPKHYGDNFTTDAVVIKTDSSGNIQWVKVLGGSLNDNPDGNVIEKIRGEYILHIGSYSNDYDLVGSGILGHKRWIIKLDSMGNILDDNVISAVDDLFISSGQEIELNNDEMILAGYANPETNLFPGVEGFGGDHDGAIAIFDDDLNLTDMKVFGGTSSDIFYRIHADSYGNYYLLGVSSSDDYDLPDNYGPSYDYWLMKLDNNFNKIWSKNFGGSNACGDLGCSSFVGDFVIRDNMLYVFVKAIVPDAFPDYDIECGHMNAFDDYAADAWLVAFDLSTGIQENEIKTEPFSVYVNSDNSEIIVLNNLNAMKIEDVAIYNTSGSCVFKNNYSIENSIEIPTSKFSPGLFFVIISDNCTARFISKVVIQH